MTHEDFTMRHLFLYFVCGGVGGVLIYISYEMRKNGSTIKEILLPLILGIILVIGWLIGVIFFSVYDEEDRND